jgi:pimeloyl-ACP methyl ester carboxylesterase
VIPQPAASQGYTVPPGYTVSQGYLVPQGYTVSQGYLVPQGYVVYQGYVVPQSHVPQARTATPGEYIPATPQPIAPQGYVPVTPQPVPAQSYVPATPQPVAPQGYVPVTPQPVPAQSYIPQPSQVSQPGYVPQPGQVSQPGFISQPSQVSQPGFVSQPSYIQQPGQISQPGYVSQPGFVSQQQEQPAGYLPPLKPALRLPRDRSTLFTLGGVVLAVLILLGVILGAVVRSGSGTSSPGSSATAVPTISSAPTSSVGKPTSAFQASACPFAADANLLQEKRLSCGYVTAPETRASKSSPKVKLAVAIFKAQPYLTTADPNPVIRLDGGPGGPSLSGWAQAITSGNIRDFVFNHDVVMFDQRGTGYSTPALDCPELSSYVTAEQSSNVTYEEAAQTCYKRLTAGGIDLNSFNTLQNAADVADIIHALGYQQMTLYGVSYGTRLALTVMRLYPSVVHATVLDSVDPPNLVVTNDITQAAQRVFTVLFQGCAKDTNCNSKYPNLQNVFYALVDQLNAKPISFYTVDATTNEQHTITFAGDDLINFIFSSLYVTSIIPVLPQVIYQIKAQQYTQLAYIYSYIGFDDTLSLGLYYSTECSEDGPYATPSSILQSEQGVDPHLVTVFAKEDALEEHDICQLFWKVKPAPAVQGQPVTSNIPTLITTGEYDPVTPPSNGQSAAKTLSHSYFFEFPGQGHGQLYSSSCSDLIVSSFEDNPSVRPDGSCINQMTEPQFV